MDHTTLTTAAEVISNLGLTGALLMGILAFMKGAILPKSVVQEMMEHAVAQTELLATKLSKEFAESTQEAVKQGVRDGIYEGVKLVQRDGHAPPSEPAE